MRPRLVVPSVYRSHRYDSVPRGRASLVSTYVGRLPEKSRKAVFPNRSHTNSIKLLIYCQWTKRPDRSDAYIVWSNSSSWLPTYATYWS